MEQLQPSPAQPRLRGDGVVQSKLCVGDTCIPRRDSDKKTIGLVARTFHDLESHALSLGTQFPDGVTRDEHVATSIFDQFMTSGIPPLHYIVVTWMDFDGIFNSMFDVLMPESAVIATDRELLMGDVVKLNTQDAMSGTVIAADTQTDLLQPRGWPKERAGADRSGRLPLAVNGKLLNVPAGDLIDSRGYMLDDQIVLYKGWVGKIIDYWHAIRIRLSDGGVVELEDPELLEEPNDFGDVEPQVGDFLTTKKSNLRRGTWIFGAYNANTPPSGYVVEVRVISADVQWLQQRYSHIGIDTTDLPDVLEREQLESPDLHLLDTSRLSSSNAGLARVHSTDVGIGDRVRFRDLTDATAKYGSKLKRIPREQSLGFDLNVFTVAAIHTRLTILWQDLRKTTHSSVELLPASDNELEDDIWPGELIVTKENATSSDDATRIPQRVGIAQRVNSAERLASVRWFEGAISFAGDDPQTLLPGSCTGKLRENIEDVSMYDIWSTPGLSRRLGDLVLLEPLSDDKLMVDRADSGLYQDLINALHSSEEERKWFGEVVELGLDGLLTVRLCAASDVRDIRVPWECTRIAYGTDHEAIDSEGSTNSLDASSEDRSFMDLDGATWRNEDDQIIDDAEEPEWTTDEEGGEEQLVADILPDDTEDDRPQTRKTYGSEISPLFSYENMFQTAAEQPSMSGPESFAILDGAAPKDHHFSKKGIQVLDTHMLRRIQKEHKILRSSLPTGVFVRSWEASLDMLRVLILGPLGTPYEYAPFMFDMHLSNDFPRKPPRTFFHSWTDGTGDINPNLYEDGTICLSLLGTWPGDDQNDTWTSQSTILQILVSLLGLVLVKEPYYNEAGFEGRVGVADFRIPSAQYSERVFLASRQFILRAITHPIPGFEDIIRACYTQSSRLSPQLLIRATWSAIETYHRSKSKPSIAMPADPQTLTEGICVSTGALIPLARHLNALLKQLSQSDPHSALQLRGFFDAAEPGLSLKEVMKAASGDAMVVD